MHTPHWFFNILLILIFIAGGHAKAQTEGETNNLDLLEQKYQDILKQEREQMRKGDFVEDLASGLAALTIGLYGYYNDNRGISSKLIYSATQTAGVLMISQTIRKADQPSLLLQVDKNLRKRESMDLETYKKMVVRIDERLSRSQQKQLAYTSLILGSIYGYNAYREKQIPGLRNVFGFLSANFLVVSGVNFFKLSQAKDIFLQDQNTPPKLSILAGEEFMLQWTQSL